MNHLYNFLAGTVGTLFAVVFIIVAIAAIGFVNVWALNTLFPSLNIPYTVWTWLASVVLFGNLTVSRKRD